MSEPANPTGNRKRVLIGGAALIVITAILGLLDDHQPLDETFSGPLDDFASWAQRNRRTHWLFTAILQPLSRAVEFALSTIEDALLWLPWYVIPLAIFAFIARTRDWPSATLATVAMLYTGVIGLWEVTLETLALMTVAVLISILIGVPLGIVAAARPRVDQVIRPILDAMQTVPAPVYFVPMLLFFGIGRVPATFATVVYALPPMVRLTTLGLREVPAQSVEASELFGASSAQTLRKVKLPMAMPTILAGVTQTIMMALGIVVLATLLGAGGLGQEIMDTLSQRRTGRGIATGLAVAAIAMVLDRLGRAVVIERKERAFAVRTRVAVGLGLVVATIAGKLAGISGFPDVWEPRAFDPIDDLVDWARDNLRFATRPFNDFVVGSYYVPVRDSLQESVPWLTLLLAASLLGYALKGPRLALLIAALLYVVRAIGMWDLSLDTLVQVVAATVLSVLVAVPIGVAAGRSRRVNALLGPFLDALQTVPSLVYIIPAVLLFTIGVLPGIIASVLYAMVPGVRLTALGVQQVPEESIEASEVFGASRRQTMLKVRLPLAARTIFAGINQVIMMVLAMVIISGLVGGGGLGFETISAVKNSEVGLGFEVGLAIVAMAIILDRLTESVGDLVGPRGS